MATPANLNIVSLFQSFTDAISSNPKKKFFDFNRQLLNISVTNPKIEEIVLAPAEQKTIFDATRSTTIGPTTLFTVTLSAIPTETSRYRFTWVGGTNPTLRTDRALTLSGVAVTFTANANGTVNVTVPTSQFSTVQSSDIVFIPGLSTGDLASPFNSLNVGFWQVIAVISNTNIQLMRLPTVDVKTGESSGIIFSGATETITPTSNPQFQAFSATGVQENDKVLISAGFATATQKEFKIVTVTSNFFEVISATPIPLESNIAPGASGMVFYSSAKRFFRIEADQELVVRANSSTDNSQRVSPIIAGDKDQVGWYDKFGILFNLTLINKSSSNSNILMMSAE